MPRRGGRKPAPKKNAVTTNASGKSQWFSDAFGNGAASRIHNARAAGESVEEVAPPERCAGLAASLLADVEAQIAAAPAEPLLTHLKRFRDILLLLQRPGVGEYHSAPATVRSSLENTIDMSTGVVGIKATRKKMHLLLKHQLKLVQYEEMQKKAAQPQVAKVYSVDSTTGTTQPAPLPSVDDDVAAAAPSPSDFYSDSDEDDDFDYVDPHVGDNASVWEQCKAEGEAWGGRGKGGRGIARQHQCMSLYTKDIILRAVSLSFGTKELLEDSDLRIVHGHRYGLIGDNGVGKSTLLRQLAKHGIPGQPRHLRCLYVKQEISVKVTDTRTTVELLIDEGGVEEQRSEMQERIADLSTAIDEFEFDDAATGGDDGESLAALHERLAEYEDDLAALSEDKMTERAVDILQGLGFSESLIHGPASALSGGWRMRLAIAQAFFQRPAVLLLDEPTNHLDIDGVLWLQSYLTDPSRLQTLSLVVVSHDRAFLQAVATDIIIFKDKKLTEFQGTIAEYYAAKDESQRFKMRLLDQRMRQEAKAKESIHKAEQRAQQQAKRGGKKHVNEKAQKQLKQQKNKMGRIGLYREDGKRYKQQSLKKLDESAIRLASKISGADLERPNKELKFTFGAPTSLRSGADQGDLISAENLSCGYKDPETGAVTEILHDVTFRIAAGSRMALVGPNGAGKSTLVKVLHRHDTSTQLNASQRTRSGDAAKKGRRRGRLHLIGGSIQRATGVRTALVQQHHVAALGKYASKTGVEYLSERFSISPLDARTHLGKFGLVGNSGITKIKALSGGQQMRLYLATIFHNPPHLLILDEPTNHLDMDALDALGKALESFQGAVVVISHNQHFCSQFCTSLYEIDHGTLTCVHEGQDRAHFDSVFTKYKARLFEQLTGKVSNRSVDFKAARHIRGFEDTAAKRGARKVAGAGKQTALM